MASLHCGLGESSAADTRYRSLTEKNRRPRNLIPLVNAGAGPCAPNDGVLTKPVIIGSFNDADSDGGIRSSDSDR